MRLQTLVYSIGLIIFAAFIYNEFIVYFLVLSQCRWPAKLDDSVRVMLLADTHLLGPFRGHWFDKLRREWQMRRAFHATIWLHQPEVVFILGDVFDEGQFVDGERFESYLMRFHDIFYTPANVKVYSAVGNHDVGFHYRLHPYVVDRFRKAFKESHNTLITIKNSHFVLLNSMTLSRDGCYFCAEAEEEIKRISLRLNCAKETSNFTVCERLSDKLPFYARPILLQHFPTYRESDEICEEHDSPVIETYRENWEVLSKDATKFIGKVLNPVVSFSGHSHHYCRSYNMWNIEEFTIASFSWRNKRNPSFLLAEFSKNEYAISKCDLPNEITVVLIYIICSFVSILLILYFIYEKCRSRFSSKRKEI